MRNKTILSNSDLKSLLQDAQNGTSVNQLMKKYHLGYSRLTNILSQNNIKVALPPKEQDSTFLDNVFETIDTEEKAYWLGFIYADGCVSRIDAPKNHKYTFEIALAEKDKEHLEKLRVFFNSKKELSKHISTPSSKPGACNYRLSRQSKKLWTDLVDKGCVPNKSLTLTFPNETILPSELKMHFIRGYVDGDGWIGCNKKQDLNHFGLCGSKDFLTEIENIFGKGQWGNSGQIKTLSYSITKGIPILKSLYLNANVFLERKYKLALTCIENYSKRKRRPKRWRRKPNNSGQN